MFLIDYEGDTQVLGPAGHVLARQTSDKASASSVLQGSPMVRCFLLAPLHTGDSRTSSRSPFRASTFEMHFANFVKITVIMGFAWGFTGGILFTGVLALPDHIVRLIVEYPTELTLIVTLISTTLSIITSMFFTFAVKEALRHHLSGPMTLFKLRTAIALSRPTWVLRWRSLKLSALTLAVYAVITFLNTSWSTLLLPTLVQWPVATFGTELDLGSVAFVNQLSTDLNAQEANTVQAPGFQTINVLTLLSGIAAVDDQGGVQTSSIFSFNGVSYNQSTGGVLPAIEEYSGSSNPPGSDVGLAFTGGQVPVNTTFDWGRLGRDAGTQGIAKNYTVTQQGVTANVSCQPIDRSQNTFIVQPNVTQGPLDFTFFTWEAGVNCSGTPGLNTQLYFTAGNASGQMDNVTQGFLPTVVCPNPQNSTFNPYKFDVFMAGLYKYDFLPTTVCEVVPYLTTVNVTYNGGIISVDRIDTSTSSPNFPLSQYIATVMAYQSGANQGMTTNTIGDFLTAYGTSNVSTMYSELEDYWRGVTEFASTQLRSGYSASGVPSNMTTLTNGMMYITTYGWRSQAHTYILLLVVITMIWGATLIAAGYSLIQEKIHASDPSFDFSDPVDLVIAASGGRLESYLHEGERNKYTSEDVTVRFEDVPDKMGRRMSKRLVTVVPEPLPKSAEP
ncbi:hypothetical protein DFJ58DRAFT_846391 [Suillus subalutaceus]|uniref:uncharacterized protein n=1 Tax=Suillus subalutaceus TaxID=48586 RepID=UPI001B86DA1E|nr:uncharacterized protein DFJ58DRAFT_846391 [Suillus subalutaceus]KAG1837652.1 hypothetical protein DFJ58DRAFT_846391 [Suillus subalutaceus]